MSSCSPTPSSTRWRAWRPRPDVEVSLFARPNAGLGHLGDGPLRPRAASFAPAARGQEQVVAALDDIRRAADHGFRSVLIADLGVLSVFAQAREAGSCSGRHAGEDLGDAAGRERRPPRACSSGSARTRSTSRPTCRSPRSPRSARRGRPARRLRRGAGQRRRLRPPARDPGADPRRRPGLREVRPAERARRLPRRHAPRLDDRRPLARARPPRTARDGAARPLGLRAGDLRARRARGSPSRCRDRPPPALEPRRLEDDASTSCARACPTPRTAPGSPTR